MAKNKLDSPDYVPITKEDIADHFWIESKFNPHTAQDKMMQSQIAQAMRQPDKAGIPLMSDYDIHEKVLQEPHPEEVVVNAEMQAFIYQNPDVMKLKQAALFSQWKEDNKELVKIAEKELEPSPAEQDKEFQKFVRKLTPEKFKEIVKAAAQLEMGKMQGLDPNQMMQMAQAQQAAMQSNQDRMGMIPATVQAPQQAAPAQPPPEAMPSQMMMPNAGAQTGVIPEEQQVEQMARGKARQG